VPLCGYLCVFLVTLTLCSCQGTNLSYRPESLSTSSALPLRVASQKPWPQYPTRGLRAGWSLATKQRDRRHLAMRYDDKPIDLE